MHIPWLGQDVCEDYPRFKIFDAFIRLQSNSYKRNIQISNDSTDDNNDNKDDDWMTVVANNQWG